MANALPSTVVIFDCDGTLLDTEPAYLEAESGIAATYCGVTLDQFKTVVPRLLGTVPADSARIVIDAFGLPLTPEQYLTERNSRTDSLFPQVAALPGCEKLTRHLTAHGIPFGIATSSSRHTFAQKMSRHGPWLSTFQTVVTGDDVTRGKPDPEIFEKAARSMGSTPGPHCIVFEDAPAGVAAGKAANMRCVALKNEFTDADAYEDADVLLNSMEEFKPEQFGLPPYPLS